MWEIVQRDVGEREELDEVVHSNLLGQSARRASKTDHLCGEDGAEARSREWTSRDPTRGCHATLQSATQSQVSAIHDVSGPGRCDHCDERRSQRPMGCDGTNSHVQLPGGDALHTESSLRDGERGERDSEPLASSPARSAVDQLHLAGDIDHDFEQVHFYDHQINHRQQKFNSLVKQFTLELQEVSLMPNNCPEPVVQVMEVLCSPQSELTKQVNNMGYRAIRFGYQEGDVSTKRGRVALFQKLIACRPRHLWYSPTCGPGVPGAI